MQWILNEKDTWKYFVNMQSAKNRYCFEYKSKNAVQINNKYAFKSLNTVCGAGSNQAVLKGKRSGKVEAVTPRTTDKEMIHEFILSVVGITAKSSRGEHLPHKALIHHA